MNPEEEFEQFWAADEYSPNNLKAACKQAFLAGHSQGMTRAAEICNQRSEDWKLIGNTRANAAVECKQAILTERDQKKEG